MCEPQDRVRGPQPPRPAAGDGDHAGAVAPGRAWVARILVQHVEHVAEVEPHRVHAQLDLARKQRRLERGLLLQPQVADRASRLQVEPRAAPQQAGRRQAGHAPAAPGR
eukprot:scaffold17172_cov69-Phaeocystis_antarctica.AAC.1